MRSLREIFESHEGRLIHKFNHYIDTYERYFEQFRNKEVTIMEIGLSQGGSIDMWKEYFGPKLKYYGVDINPDNRSFEEENVTIFIGSQSDRSFLKDLTNRIPKLDILIDDGGHTMEQQIVTFEVMFDMVKPGGVYLCEDVHTSYWKLYHGKHKGSGTFIEYSKNFIDQIHAWFSEDKSSFKVDNLTRNIKAIHYYTNLVFIEKENMPEPFEVKKGNLTIGFTGDTGVDELNLSLKARIGRIAKKIKSKFSKTS